MGRGNRAAAIASTSKTEESSTTGQQFFGNCGVCGAGGARPHYGTISCNGCRSFFRRCIWGNKHYKCLRDGNCSVAHGTRRACRGCRLSRCYAEGMDAMLVEGDRERLAPATTHAVVSARELMKRQTIEREETGHETPEDNDELPPLAECSSEPVDSRVLAKGESMVEMIVDIKSRDVCLPKRLPSPLQLFAHAAIVQYLVDQEHWVEQLGSTGTGCYGLDGGRLFRTDVPMSAVCKDPGIAVVRTPICWEGRRLIEPSDVPFMWTRSFVLCVDWASLLSDFYALSVADREVLLRARITVVAMVLHFCNARFGRHGENVMLFVDGTYYPNDPELQSSISPAFVINQYFQRNSVIASDEAFVSMRELMMDDGEMAVVRALALFTSTPKLSPAGKLHVEQTRTRYVDALYAHIRQRRPELSERRVAMRVAKILLLLPPFTRMAYEEDAAIQALALFNVIDMRGLPYEVHTPGPSA